MVLIDAADVKPLRALILSPAAASRRAGLTLDGSVDSYTPGALPCTPTACLLVVTGLRPQRSRPAAWTVPNVELIARRGRRESGRNGDIRSRATHTESSEGGRGKATARMSSHGRRIARDLGRLHELARRLFDLVSEEYQPVADVTLRLSECDAVAENPHCSDPVVRTVLVAQMLWYATDDPTVANPRHVIGLGLFAEELIPALLAEHPPDGSVTARRLHEIRGEIDNLCMNLAMAADPGIPEFDRG